MRYKIALHKSDEGYSLSAPGLPGCWSQGKTEAEALANIEAAIREYFSVVDDLLKDAEVREIEPDCMNMRKLPGVNHLDAVRALKKAGFRIARQGKHIIIKIPSDTL